MTDLEKAKQFIELYPKEFDEDTLNYRVCHEETVLFKGCWADALMFQEHAAIALAAYASHSNSELLERVQKLEKWLERFNGLAKTWHSTHHANRPGHCRLLDPLCRAMFELEAEELAKAPDTMTRT